MEQLKVFEDKSYFLFFVDKPLSSNFKPPCTLTHFWTLDVQSLTFAVFNWYTLGTLKDGRPMGVLVVVMSPNTVTRKKSQGLISGELVDFEAD